MRLVYDDEGEEFLQTKIYERDNLPTGFEVRGPAIVEEMDSTSFIPRGSSGVVDKEGNILIEV
jgi:N-methylhydantoinase A